MTYPHVDPMSIKGILRAQGIPPKNIIRASYSRGLDDALFLFWMASLADHGDPAQAAVMMWWMVSRDPSFRHPLWLAQVFQRHRAAVVEAHHEGCFKS